MTGIRRLRSLEPERRRGGQGDRGLGRGGCYSGGRTGRGGRDVGGMWRHFFFFLLPAQPQADKTEKVGRTTSRSFFFLTDV